METDRKECTSCRRIFPKTDEYFGTYKKKKQYISDSVVYICWHSHCRECRAEVCRKWRKKNPDKVQKYYLEVDKAKGPERTRRYRERHPDRVKEISHRHNRTPKGMANNRKNSLIGYYRRKAAPGFYTEEQLQARWDYFDGKCWMCGKEAKGFDHVIAITNGGTNWPSNLRPVCISCNARKGNRF